MSNVALQVLCWTAPIYAPALVLAVLGLTGNLPDDSTTTKENR